MRSEPAYQTLRDRLRGEISAGHYRDGARLPWFASLDLYVNAIVGLPGHLPDARVGLKLYSLASVHSARDVQRDVARPDFAATYNPVPRDFTMVFELLWGHR